MIPDMVGRHLGSLRISQGVCKIKSYFQNKARQYLPLRTDRSKCRRTASWGVHWTQGCGSLRHTARVLHLHTLAAKTNASTASFAWACPWESSKMHFISAHLVPWGHVFSIVCEVEWQESTEHMCDGAQKEYGCVLGWVRARQPPLS